MMSIEQLRLLQKKVTVLVGKYQELATDNALLKKKLQSYEQRVAELESHYSLIQEDQNEMERAILTALEELDKIEGSVVHESPARETTQSNSNLGI